MDAVGDFDEVNKTVEKILKLRKKGNDFQDAVIEDTANYINGHLDQINRRLAEVGDYLDKIDEQKK